MRDPALGDCSLTRLNNQVHLPQEVEDNDGYYRDDFLTVPDLSSQLVREIVERSPSRVQSFSFFFHHTEQ
jgi:hypothetical protein